MSDEKNARTVEEIQREYSNLCTKLGHVTYQLFALGKDSEMILDTLRDLNIEAATAHMAAQKAAEDAAKASAPVVVEAPKAEEVKNA